MEEDAKCKICSNERIDKINVQRFLNKLDSCYSNNNLHESLDLCKFWEESAKQINDKKGLITVLNEELGIYRRLNKKEEAILVSEQIVDLLHELKLETMFSSAIVYTNAATNFSIFGEDEKAEYFYQKAFKVYNDNNKKKTYEYAALLNNYAVRQFNKEELNNAEKYYCEAIDILMEIGNHDSEIALSYLGLCHVYFDKGVDNITTYSEDDVYSLVEKKLDLAIKYLFSESNKIDTHYAFDLSKSLSSLKYFGRIIEHNKAESISKKIYEDNYKTNTLQVSKKQIN